MAQNGYKGASSKKPTRTERDHASVVFDGFIFRAARERASARAVQDLFESTPRIASPWEQWCIGLQSFCLSLGGGV